MFWLLKYLKTRKDLYFVGDNGWCYGRSLKFIGSYEECLQYLNMTEEEYQFQLKNSDHSIEGHWFYAIEPFVECYLNAAVDYYEECRDKEEERVKINYKNGYDKGFENGQKNALEKITKNLEKIIFDEEEEDGNS